MMKTLSRLLFSAPASGGGKTTVTCAFLRALMRRGISTASYKCGPDYIDPMFHRESVGTVYSSNLDLFFSDKKQVCHLLARGAARAAFAVIEGAMGYYDGISSTEQASSYALARATGTPVVLVVDCRGMALSIAAQVKGFLDFRQDSNLAAVFLNRVSPARFSVLKEQIERECGLPVVGYLPPMPECALESRQLGLVTAAEVARLSEKLDTLAARLEQTTDMALLMRIASGAPPLDDCPPVLPEIYGNPVIAVARDKAFCFYYPDTLVLLEKMGAILREFSPLSDRALPEDTDGLLLGGGYPEIYAGALAENSAMRFAVKTAIEHKMPTIAECGGFLYLHNTLLDTDGISHPMAGVIHAEGFPTGHLGRFGYVSLRANTDNLLCQAGETLSAHEFHYWDSTAPGESFLAQKPHDPRNWRCVHATKNLYAGFPHLYLPAYPQAAARFLAAALHRREE